MIPEVKDKSCLSAGNLGCTGILSFAVHIPNPNVCVWGGGVRNLATGAIVVSRRRPTSGHSDPGIPSVRNFMVFAYLRIPQSFSNDFWSQL